MSTSPPLISIHAIVNGQPRQCQVEHRHSLAEMLREGLGLKGTHVGCEHGVCGACTVVADGVSARSCLMLAAQADGMSITTIEGLADGKDLHALQQAFWDHHGLQCGFCTPGILMSLLELLNANSDPTEAEVREVLSGHLCRCTGYHNIVVAALAAAQALRTQRT